MRRATPWSVTVIAFVAFISLGAPDAVLGVAWPDIQLEFGLPSAGIGLILASSATGYFLSSTFAGTVMRYIPLGWLLVISTGLVAVGLFGYSFVPFVPWFMILAFGIGAGSGAIDTGLNAYATEHFSATTMNWLHGFFGIGAMLGPFVMTAVLTSGASWQTGYVLVAGFVLLMAIIFVVFRRVWEEPAGRREERHESSVSLMTALRQRSAVVQIAVFFVYCGVEVVAGQWGFTVLRDRFGASEGMAGFWVGMYWGSIAAGRLLFGPLVDRVGARLIVRISLVATILGAAFYVVPLYEIAVAGLLVTGLGLAIVFPTLITLTSRRLPAPMVTHTVGFSVAAAVAGGAALPTLAGVLKGTTGTDAIPWLILVLAVGTFGLNELLSNQASRADGTDTAVVALDPAD